MMRRKNLERAIVLGLLLRTSVYGSAWAEPAINDDTVDSQPQYKDSVTIEGDTNTSAIEITKDNEVPVTIKGEESITLESGKYGIRLEADRDITLNAGGDNVIKVTVNSSDDEIGDGINVTENAGGTITVTGANNTIRVTGASSDGIYTDTGNNTAIYFTANGENGSNTINAENNAIDHRGSNTITYEATGSNIITAQKGDGIRVEGTGGVILNANNNTITAGDNGIQVSGGGTVNVTAAGGSNTITANTNGIYASGSNSTVNLKGTVNTIIVNGTDENTKNNAILAESNSTINIVEGGSLNISLNKTPYSVEYPTAGDNVSGIKNYGSNLNINTGNGFADIDVISNTDKYMSETTGISLNTREYADEGKHSYGDATTTISGKYVDINVSNNVQETSGNVGTSGAVYGIHLNDTAEENEKKANLTLTANGYYTDTINEEERNIGINIIANNDGYVSDPNSATAVGIKLNGNAEAVITANTGDVNISANSKNSYGNGIQVNGYANSATNLSVTGVNTNITGSYAGVWADGSLGKNTETKVKINAIDGNNYLKGTTFGILSRYGAKTKFEALNGYNFIESGNTGIYTNANNNGKSKINLSALGNTIQTTTYGIYSDFGEVNLYATGDSSVNEINSGSYAIYSQNDGEVNLIAENSNYIESEYEGIRSFDSNIYFAASQGNNNIVAKQNGIFAQSWSTDWK